MYDLDHEHELVQHLEQRFGRIRKTALKPYRMTWLSRLCALFGIELKPSSTAQTLTEARLGHWFRAEYIGLSIAVDSAARYPNLRWRGRTASLVCSGRTLEEATWFLTESIKDPKLILPDVRSMFRMTARNRTRNTTMLLEHTVHKRGTARYYPPTYCPERGWTLARAT